MNEQNIIEEQSYSQGSYSKAVSVTHSRQLLMSANPPLDRRSLLPAYPTFNRHASALSRDHHSFHQPFTLIDQSNDISIRPFFVCLYQHLYSNLARRFYWDNVILDYNYECLRECLNMMVQERIRYGLHPEDTAGSELFRFDEYALAIEFYLQIDGKLSFFIITH